MVKNNIAVPDPERLFLEEMHRGNPNYLVVLQSLTPKIQPTAGLSRLQKPVIL